MKITIPYNIFIFIFSLLGVIGLGYSYVEDIIAGINLFSSRTFYSQLFLFLFCLLYAIKYLKHTIGNNAKLGVLNR